MGERSGPLIGLKIIELAGIGPGPFCAMLLADLGATVLRVDRPDPPQLGIKRPLRYDLLRRSRETLSLDLKSPEARELLLQLAEQADGLIEGFRPGVAERLGLGPDDLLGRNPRIVYGRITGWGQSGPMSQTAGHDINYLALTGALAMFGDPAAPPSAPLNLLGDYSGGGLYLALGMLAGLMSAQRDGHGQVVDTAIVDGVGSLMTTFHGMLAANMLRPERGANVLDGGAYYYGCYACADGRYVAVGPIEPKFHAQMLAKLGISTEGFPDQDDEKRWPEARARMAEIFRTRPRDHWAEVFDGSDACVSPVLTLAEAATHPQAVERSSFVEVDGVVQPAPAPRFSRTPAGTPSAPCPPDNDSALAGWLDTGEIERLRAKGTIA